MDLKEIAVYGIVFIVCLGILVLGGGVHEQLSAGLRGIPLIGLLLPLPVMESPMYYVHALIGFVIGIVVIKWAEKYFETKIIESPLYFLIGLIGLYLVYYISYVWYYANFTTLGGGAWPDFWLKLQNSSYYAFLFAFICGWIAEYIKRKTLD